MTRFEFLTVNESLCRLMVDNSINPKEIEFLSLVKDYEQMRAKEHKVGYIVSYLADKYKVSERFVYKTIKNMHGKIL